MFSEQHTCEIPISPPPFTYADPMYHDSGVRTPHYHLTQDVQDMIQSPAGLASGFAESQKDFASTFLDRDLSACPDSALAYSIN